jgi:hypothetical protein
MPPSDLKQLALLMAVNCVRNTVIEDYHSDGKLSDAEMKAFNQEVANKIYTFLHYLYLPGQDQEAFLNAMGMMYPNHWDQPELDSEFVEAANQFNKKGNPLEFASASPSPSNASTSSTPKRAVKRKKK